MPEKKRVLVVDDSVFARKIVSDILTTSPELTVIGTANDGVDALAKIESLRPDVVTLDIEMPKLDGLETLRQLMFTRPTPVIMVSSLTQEGAAESVRALKLGAVDIVAKPHGTHSIGLAAQAKELISKVVAAAGVKVERLLPAALPTQEPRTPAVGHIQGAYPVVMVASSTGGPRALRTLLPALSKCTGAGYVLIQHLPEGFSKTMADDLNQLTDLAVSEAHSEPAKVRPGHVLLAKAGYHLIFDRSESATLTLAPPLWGVRPSADVTMVSAAPVFGSRMIGVVLTGMGHDGAAGLRAIRESGGTTIAEHESTCVVYGMPRTAIEAGVVDVVEPLDRIATAIVTAVSRSVRRMAA